jgi:diguanylate cyclase (GGDEF)-like protein
MAGMIVIPSYKLETAYKQMSATTEEHIEMEEAAHSLMDASDYLTEQVQRFVLTGDITHLNAYFSEAEQSKRRDDALEIMGRNPDNASAFAELKEAMEGSLELMNIEFYAMRLVLDAQGITTVPDALKTVQLSDEDAALSPDGKKALAADLVFSEDYYNKKDAIRKDMEESIGELILITKATDEKIAKKLKTEIIVIQIIVVIQVLGFLLVIWLTSRFGIKPLLTAVEDIKEDRSINEYGAKEFRYLAAAYNRMFSIYKKNIDRLEFKASHDALTGAYNRAGYELLMQNIDFFTAYYAIVDVDDFKQVNDNYGHEVGDKVLIKVVNSLKKNFKSNDYVCRLGGDEFAVIVVDIDPSQNSVIENRFKKINRELAKISDGLPPVSLSVGVAHGSHYSNQLSMIHDADEAVYRTKSEGKNGVSFANS